MDSKIIAQRKEGLVNPVTRIIPKDGLFYPVRRITPEEKVEPFKEENGQVAKNVICPVDRLETKANKNSWSYPMINQQTTYEPNMTKYESKEMRMGNYFYRDGQLICIDNSREIKLSNFWIEILAEKNFINLLGDATNNVVGTEISVRWKVRIFCANRWYEAEASRDELQSERKLLAMTRDRAMLESSMLAKNLYVQYIVKLIEQENYKSLDIYSTSGWIDHPKWGWIYLTREGALGISGCNCFANVPYTFQYNPNSVGTIDTFREVWNLRFLCKGSKENSIFLMHFVCLATMATLFQKWGCGINFIVALIGTTNSLKTSCAKVFTQMFQRPENTGIDIRFSSTEVAIMEEMERYGDAVMTVDDYIPFEDKPSRNIQKKKLDTIIRAYGDHEARKRSNVYAKINGVPTYSPIRGACLVTGEIIDFSSESSATRVIQLKFERGQVDTQLLKHYQEHSLILPTFLFDFVCYVRENMQDIMNTAITEVARARIECPQIKTPRFKDVFGIMSAIVVSVYKYAVKRRFMNIENAEFYSEEDKSMIKKIIINNDSEVKIKSPAVVICFALEKAIREGNIMVIDERDAIAKSEFKNTAVNTEEYIYILPETLCDLYSQYCRSTGREMIYKSGRELNAPLKKDNVLLVKTEGNSQRSTHKIKGNTEQRFLFLRKQKIKELTAIFNEF